MSTLPIADTQTTAEVTPSQRPEQATFAICLPSMPADAFHSMLDRLQQSLPGEPLLIASPDHPEEQILQEGSVHLVPYPSQRSSIEWVLGAADYAAAAKLANERSLTGVLLVGTDAASLDPTAVAELRRALQAGADLAVPEYRVGADEGLVNSALLYPLTRALFGIDIRFPLPLDAAISRRLLARLGAPGSRTQAGSEEVLLWPVAEASVLGYNVQQVADVGRALPRPQQTDLNTLLPAVCSSLFGDVEAKATYWQRARTLPAGRPAPKSGHTGEPADAEEIRSLTEGYRLAFSNLREIWSLVVPPQSLLALKKLSITPAESFRFPPNLWARVVYDFALAFHMRTLNRGHLLGSMTPLYLAWVASRLQENNSMGAGSDPLQATASAFEQEKPYMVSRWRWPDRFNP